MPQSHGQYDWTRRNTITVFQETREKSWYNTTKHVLSTIAYDSVRLQYDWSARVNTMSVRMNTVSVRINTVSVRLNTTSTRCQKYWTCYLVVLNRIGNLVCRIDSYWLVLESYETRTGYISSRTTSCFNRTDIAPSRSSSYYNRTVDIKGRIHAV